MYGISKSRLQTGFWPATGVLGPGLVLLTLRAGRADGYGARAWPLLVGGAGLGDEPELAQMLGVP